MKKIILSALTAVLLISCLITCVFANEEIFTFKLNGFNGRIAGGDAYLYSSVESWANNNPNWAYSLHLASVEGAAEGYYTVVKTVNCTGNDGNSDPASIIAADYFPDYNAENGDLLITVHSNGADDPNSKAWGINAEQIVHLVGINTADLTVTSDACLEFSYGMQAPPAADNGESSAPAEDSSAPADESSTASDITSEPVSEDSSATSEVIDPNEASSDDDSSVPTETSKAVSESKTESNASTASEPEEDSGSAIWIIVGIIAAVVVIAVVIVVIKKKK